MLQSPRSGPASADADARGWACRSPSSSSHLIARAVPAPVCAIARRRGGLQAAIICSHSAVTAGLLAKTCLRRQRAAVSRNGAGGGWRCRRRRSGHRPGRRGSGMRGRRRSARASPRRARGCWKSATSRGQISDHRGGDALVRDVPEPTIAQRRGHNHLTVSFARRWPRRRRQRRRARVLVGHERVEAQAEEALADEFAARCVLAVKPRRRERVLVPGGGVHDDGADAALVHEPVEQCLAPLAAQSSGTRIV